MKKKETHTKWQEFYNVKGELCRFRHQICPPEKEVEYGTPVYLVNSAGNRMMKPEVFWVSEEVHFARDGLPMSQAEMIKAKWGTPPKCTRT